MTEKSWTSELLTIMQEVEQQLIEARKLGDKNRIKALCKVIESDLSKAESEEDFLNAFKAMLTSISQYIH